MAGSVAEERIRVKVDAYLRRHYVEARVIHELVLEQGGCRIDVAAVGPDFIVAAEIKSERDTLKRLRAQLDAALGVARLVLVCVAPEHIEALEAAHHMQLMDQATKKMKSYKMRRSGRRIDYEATTYPLNPDYIPKLRRARILVENDDGLEAHDDHRYWREPIVSAHPMLEMLHAFELQRIASPLGASTRTTRTECMRLAVEHLTGRQVRREACAALRSRGFPRADEAVEWARPK